MSEVSALDLGDALDAFDLAEHVDLDCGAFSIRIRQAALHNEAFKAGVTKAAMRRKRKSLVEEPGTLTGGIEEDVELYIKHVLIGWGTKKDETGQEQAHPLRDAAGKEVPFKPENLRALFLGQGQRGRVLFGKIMTAASSDDLFRLKDDDLGNS